MSQYLKDLIDKNNRRIASNKKKIAEADRQIKSLEESIKEKRGGSLSVALMREHLQAQKERKMKLEQDIKNTEGHRATAQKELKGK